MLANEDSVYYDFNFFESGIPVTYDYIFWSSRISSYFLQPPAMLGNGKVGAANRLISIECLIRNNSRIRTFVMFPC